MAKQRSAATKATRAELSKVQKPASKVGICKVSGVWESDCHCSRCAAARAGKGPKVLCEFTGIRVASCCCGRCERTTRSTQNPAAMKVAHNTGDAAHLAEFILTSLRQLPGSTWSDAGDVAHVRERLLDIVTGLKLGPDGDERATREEIERALDGGDPAFALRMLG